MAMDAVPFNLLRSSLDSLKLQFQAVWDSGIDNRAILIQQNKHAPKLRLGDFSDIDWLLVQAGGYPAGFGKTHIRPQRCVDGSEIPIVAHGTSSGAHWRSDKPVPSFGFDRWHQVIGLSAVKDAAKAAGRLLDDLPENIRRELWDALPEGKSLPSSDSWTLWSEAVFELAWKREGKGIVGSPLKAKRHTPIRFDKPDSRPLPDDEDWYSMRDWYSKLDNFAAASVQAIEILQSWLDDVPKRETEAVGKSVNKPDGQSETQTKTKRRKSGKTKRYRGPNVTEEEAKIRRDRVAHWKRWKAANPKIRKPMERYCADETAVERRIDPPTLKQYVNWVTKNPKRKRPKRG